MQYMFLIYGDAAQDAAMTDADRQQEMGEYFAFNGHLSERGLKYQGEALHPVHTATTVRVRESKTLTTDGPFAETKEILGGFYLVDCKSLDEAIEVAGRIPGARRGSIEIRPIVDFSQMS